MAVKKKPNEEARTSALSEFYEISNEIKSLKKRIKELEEGKEMTLAFLKTHDITESGPFHLIIKQSTSKEVDIAKVFKAFGPEKSMALVTISQKALINEFGNNFPIDDYCITKSGPERVSIIKDEY